MKQREESGRACPACRQGDLEPFYSLRAVPVNSCILLATEDAAKGYPSGDITLGFCSSCGFISNSSFDQELTEYSGRYEETQGYSPFFRKFHEKLARDLVERHGLQGKKVVEIGCGKGEFLHMLCAYGNNRGLGFDPSYREDREQRIQANQIEFVADYFSGAHRVDAADFVACKMTLEHIPEAQTFVATLRSAIHGQPDSVIFVQVPESKRIFRECAFEDIYYEHCSYFTEESISELFNHCGYSVMGTSIEYGGQYLAVEAKFGSNGVGDGKADLTELRELVASFPDRVAAVKDKWKNEILKRSSAGKKIVLWGSGSKGVSFLTSLGLTSEVTAVVDINPNRQGYFMPGTGHRIVSPEALKEIKPDFVVVMNRIYTDEIREMLQDLNLAPDLAAL